MDVDRNAVWDNRRARLVVPHYPDGVAAEDVIADFATPPVVEVVTAVRFSPMRHETFLAFASHWRDAWKADFPGFELQGSYESPVERFSEVAPQAPTLSFEFPPVMVLPRVWISSADGQHLLQVQRDWFAANWRRHGGASEATYPHWPARRAEFEKRWGEFSGWLIAQGETLDAVQCEVTYINHIAPVAGIWTSHGDVERVLPGLSVGSELPARAEQAAWRSQYVVDAEGDLPQARLHVSLTPAFGGSSEPKPIYVLELTVRGAPGPGGDFGKFGDRGRRVIVESFISMTSSELRDAWGQK